MSTVVITSKILFTPIWIHAGTVLYNVWIHARHTKTKDWMIYLMDTRKKKKLESERVVAAQEEPWTIKLPCGQTDRLVFSSLCSVVSLCHDVPPCSFISSLRRVVPSFCCVTVLHRFVVRLDVLSLPCFVSVVDYAGLEMRYNSLSNTSLGYHFHLRYEKRLNCYRSMKFKRFWKKMIVFEQWSVMQYLRSSLRKNHYSLI